MGDSYSEFLKQLEDRSRVKQERFMNHIATRLKRPRVLEKPEHPFRGAPDFWHAFTWSEEERIEHFTANFQNAGGHVIRAADMQEASILIAEQAHELEAKHIIRQDESALAELGLEKALPDASIYAWNSNAQEQWKARAAEADMGVVMADYAAAYTGSVTVLSAPNKGRSVSLLPTMLVVLIPLYRLKTRLGEILGQFDQTQTPREQLPSGIHFISGPSRSADIENDLTIGVHGPGQVLAILVG